MRNLLRPFVWILVPLLLCALGCSVVHSCVHADEPDERIALRDALWEKMQSSRPSTDAIDAAHALSVTVVNVGQGDCILLLAPDGKTMLVDAGPVGAFPAIERTLDAFGVTSLDVVVATHPHEDHIGSMASVLDAYPVGLFCTIDASVPSPSYERMRDALSGNGCEICCPTGGETIAWSESCTVTVLNPIAGYPEPDELNDASLVLRVQYGDTAVLLTGDAEELAEKRMLDTYPRSMLRADVLKLGHHGSSTSTGYSFFLAVSPDLAVASCGTDNEYGHPHYETLSLLYDTRTALYRTDCDGSITFLLDGTNVSVEPTRKELP